MRIYSFWGSYFWEDNLLFLFDEKNDNRICLWTIYDGLKGATKNKGLYSKEVNELVDIVKGQGNQRDIQILWIMYGL